MREIVEGENNQSEHYNFQEEKSESEEYPDSKEDIELIYKTPGNSSLDPCPLYSLENLAGRLSGYKQAISLDDLVKVHPEVETGGRVRPRNCTAAEKVAVIIPFRSRFKHLYIMLHNVISLLQRQFVDARIFVIEQAMSTMFNRASLFNIGFLEALKIDKYDCFIFHDVDLVPTNDMNLYRCDENPVHFAAAMDKYRYELPYKQYFGGVVGFTKQQYLKINGNSNLYFGWGGEDDDLYERTINKGFEIARPYLGVGRYDMLRHAHDAGNEDNCLRRILVKFAKQRQDVEGLNTVKYKRKYVKINSHFTWINVHIDMKEVQATAPAFVKKEMMKYSHAKSSACNFSRIARIHDSV